MTDDCANITVEVGNVQTFPKDRIAAICDVAILIEGIEIIVRNVQVHRNRGNYSVELPQARDRLGFWRPSVSLPPEVEEPLGLAVADACGFRVATSPDGP